MTSLHPIHLPHMSYQDDTYTPHNDSSDEYVDNGNHSNDDYCEYEPYSDHGEPNHWEPECTPSKPNYNDYDHITDPTESNHHTNYEYDTDNVNREVNEAYQPQWSE